MEIVTLSIALISLVANVILSVVLYIKLKSIYINLYNLSKGLDVLFENEKKILELTKVKSFVELVHEEEKSIRQEISKSKQTTKDKSVEESIRPSESDSVVKGS